MTSKRNKLTLAARGRRRRRKDKKVIELKMREEHRVTRFLERQAKEAGDVAEA